jgi:Fe-S cluster assembly iron-binding protein IscA
MKLISRILQLSAVPLLILFLTSCGKSEEQNAASESKGIEVTVGNPVKKKLTEYTSLNANTVYQKQEIVRATFQGYIDKTLKNIGDNIKEDDVLFLIRTKEADAARSIKDQNVKQFDGDVNITARTNGVLTQLDHQTGDYVSDGDQLAVIVDPQSLRIMLEVPFEFANHINNNDQFVIQLPNGKNVSARIDKKIPSIDPLNQTQKFILTMNEKVDLPANLNVDVQVPVKSFSDAVSLPKSAVMSNETQTEFWVMKMLNDSTAVKLDIKKGIETDSLVQVLEPKLEGNERFVTDGAYGLPDTAKVSIHSNSFGTADKK